MEHVTRYGVKDWELLEVPAGGVLAPTDDYTEVVEARHYDTVVTQLAAVTARNKELESRETVRQQTFSQWEVKYQQGKMALRKQPALEARVTSLEAALKACREAIVRLNKAVVDNVGYPELRSIAYEASALAPVAAKEEE